MQRRDRLAVCRRQASSAKARRLAPAPVWPRNFWRTFGLVVTDPDRSEVHVVTDRFGVAPMYAGEEKGRVVVGSHPDAVAQALGTASELDLATMGQALRMRYAAFSHTYYRHVRELTPTSVHTWNREGYYTVCTCWTPRFRGDEVPGYDALAESWPRCSRAESVAALHGPTALRLRERAIRVLRPCLRPQ